MAVAQTGGSDRVKQAKPSGPLELVLTFRGMIDGSHQIKITQEAATWQHNHWQMPVRAGLDQRHPLGPERAAGS